MQRQVHQNHKQAFGFLQDGGAMSARRLRRSHLPEVPSHWHCHLLPPRAKKINVCIVNVKKAEKRETKFTWDLSEGSLNG